MPPRAKKRKREEQRPSDTAAVDAELSPKLRPANPSNTTRRNTSAPQPISSLNLPSFQSPPAASTSPSPSSSSSPSLSAPSAKRGKAKLIVVLVKSSLETIQSKRGYELVTADSHKSLLLRLKADPSAYRPDITHQALLTLLDSPLNKAGLLQVYVQTEKNVLIEVNPSIRIPRTFPRFAGLAVQLLHKLKIRASDSNEYLLRVVKGPVTEHLPAGSLKLGTSVQGTLVNMTELAQALGGGKERGEGLVNPVVLCVGAHASGPAEVDWTERTISVSQYPLSASVALSRMLNGFEQAWGIL